MSFRSQEAWPALRRRRHLRPIISFLVLPILAGLFIATPVQPVAGDELEDAKDQQAQLKDTIADQKTELSRLAGRQENLQSEIAATKAELKEINVDLGAVRRQIDDLVVRIAQAQQQYDDLVAKVATLEVILTSLGREAEEKAVELRDTKRLLADRIRDAYDADRSSPLETILTGGSFTDVIVEASYAVDIADENRILAEKIADQQAALETLEATVSTTQDETEGLRDETAARKAQLDRDKADLEEARQALERLEARTKQALDEQRRAYERLEASRQATAQSLADTTAAQKKLESKIESILRERAQQGNIPSQYNGTLIWPLSGTVTQNYGCTGFGWEPPKGECAHFHSGIDIAAPMYTPIKAAGNGTVLFAGANPYDRFPKAWIVIVAHSEGLLTWYGHVDNAVKPPAVSPGDYVTAGQTVAYVGMTGRTTGPHLHWMVEYKGDFVNPRLYL
jgi:murein DD-endopeptidase MepM/ murein hydrolase activator NlpD